MRRTVTEQEARKRILVVMKEAIAGLPTSYNGGQDYIDSHLERFANGTNTSDCIYLEFGSSFHVTATLSVSAVYWNPNPTYEAKISYGSGTTTLAQAQACHNLNGRVLEAAHAIQAAIDSLPEIERQKK